MEVEIGVRAPVDSRGATLIAMVEALEERVEGSTTIMVA